MWRSTIRRRLPGAIMLALSLVLALPLIAFIPTGARALAATQETLSVPFANGPNGATTTNSYSGSVSLNVSGFGQAAATAFSDAFYVFTDNSGNPITPEHHFDFGLCINSQTVDNYLATTPPYSSSHTYQFTIPIGSSPQQINFGVCDTFTGDNSGSYTITVNGQSSTLCNPTKLVTKAISGGFSCGSGNIGTFLGTLAEDVQNNKLQLFCSSGAEFDFEYDSVGDPSRQVGRCPWVGGQNDGEITYADTEGDGKADCFLRTFWRSVEPFPVSIVQGELGLIDWKTYDFDVQAGNLVLRHFASLDGPGGIFPDKLIKKAINVNPMDFNPNPTAAGYPPMTTIVFSPCDLDRDGDCDIDDLALLTKTLGQCDDGDNYNELADADHNGCVTSADEEILFPEGVLISLNPAKVWVGLKNSDAVGLRLDLKAEVYLDATKIGEGQLNNVSSGSSGFNNAKLNTIPITFFTSMEVPADAKLEMTLSVRRTCSGGGHNSGTARLWFNDGQANSRFGTMIGETASDLFLRSGFALATTPGSGPKLTIDVPVDNKPPCPTRPFRPFGTWSVTLP